MYINFGKVSQLILLHFNFTEISLECTVIHLVVCLVHAPANLKDCGDGNVQRMNKQLRGMISGEGFSLAMNACRSGGKISRGFC